MIQDGYLMYCLGKDYDLRGAPRRVWSMRFFLRNGIKCSFLTGGVYSSSCTWTVLCYVTQLKVTEPL